MAERFRRNLDNTLGRRDLIKFLAGLVIGGAVIYMLDHQSPQVIKETVTYTPTKGEGSGQVIVNIYNEPSQSRRDITSTISQSSTTTSNIETSITSTTKPKPTSTTVSENTETTTSTPSSTSTTSQIIQKGLELPDNKYAVLILDKVEEKPPYLLLTVRNPYSRNKTMNILVDQRLFTARYSVFGKTGTISLQELYKFTKENGLNNYLVVENPKDYILPYGSDKYSLRSNSPAIVISTDKGWKNLDSLLNGQNPVAVILTSEISNDSPGMIYGGAFSYKDSVAIFLLDYDINEVTNIVQKESALMLGKLGLKGQLSNPTGNFVNGAVAPVALTEGPVYRVKIGDVEYKAVNLAKDKTILGYLSYGVLGQGYRVATELSSQITQD
ncbi:MAG: hypothetical protein ACP5G1_00030 [Nanopusillaceae archaeon]